MKDIKTLMIGFLLATCMFLLIGADSNDSQIGRYQMQAALSHLYLLDTKSGEFYYTTIGLGDSRKWRRKSPETDWFKD